MKQTDEFRRFVKEHAGDDLTRLLLSASRYPSIDVPFAVDQMHPGGRLRKSCLYGMQTTICYFLQRYRQSNVHLNRRLPINSVW